jgi:hypothetical protein
VDANALLNQAASLRATGHYAEAVEVLRGAVAAAPARAEAHHALCNALRDLGDLDGAVTSGRRAAELAPMVPHAWGALGVAMLEQGNLDEAEKVFRKAITLDPNYVLAHFNLGETLLLKGDWREGWARFEARWVIPGGPRPNPRTIGKTLWDGKDLNGRTILLHAEAGFGDTIMGARFIPLIVERGGKVIVEVQPELVRLIASVSDAALVVAKGTALPDFDVHAPLLSLPWLLGITLDNVPAAVPYLHPGPAQISMWRDRIASDKNFSVGLAWAGSPTNPNDWRRSIPIQELQPLAALQGITFYSLQKWRHAENSPVPINLPIIDWTSDLQDFADTAALVQNLDLVIAVDSSPVHLAGALAKNVWMLTPHAPDPRWLLKREDTVWYPTMRLFRQSKPRQWSDVIQRVVNELKTISDEETS